MLSQNDIHKRLFSRGSMNRIEKHTYGSGLKRHSLPSIQYNEKMLFVCFKCLGQTLIPHS